VGVALVILLVLILLLLVGGALIGLAFKLIWFLLVGLLIGALARLVLPGRQEIGYLATALAGIAGSLLGAIIANLLDTGGVVQFLIAIACAAGLVAILDGTARAQS
jgi:uncharacterized membrane protein YeaQ/YmgE (transglycosylase-associated protein family)